MSDWTSALGTLAASGTPAVLVTVVAAKGSVPRGPGTRMVVTSGAISGTIGGGHLEFKAIGIARDLIEQRGMRALHRFPLGASLGQCCGGLLQLLFEPVDRPAPWIDALSKLDAEGAKAVVVTPVRGDAADDRMVITMTTVVGTLGSSTRDVQALELARSTLATDGAPRLALLVDGAECFFDVVRPVNLRIVLFGAGHVGRAVVRALGGLRCRIDWVDTREDAFPDEIPDVATVFVTDAPEAEVDRALPGSYFLVMTHSHALDESLAERILERGDFAYFGLIGSKAKRLRFEKRMEARGMPSTRFAAMTCPIGIAGIVGKEPEVIAIAVAAEILQLRDQKAAAETRANTQCA